LTKIAGLHLSDTDTATLLSLRKTRNAIEHYEWQTTEKEARVIIGNALSFAFSFAQEHLDTDLAADFKRDDTWKTLVDELNEFARAHGRRIEAALIKKGKCPFSCQYCSEQTVPTHGGSCELCGHWQEIGDQ